MSASDSEANRFSARAARYAKVGANVGGRRRPGWQGHGSSAARVRT